MTSSSVIRNAFIALMLAGTAATLPAQAQSAQTETMSAQDHSAWTAILSDFVMESDDGVNRFDYARLKDDASARASLNAYIETLAAQPISALPDDAQFAAWANLYNALTVQVIIENYPVDSIRDISSGLFSRGPWKQDVVTVEGETLSLDNIEHDILRIRFDDPRVHYAVNCASIGCPNLQTQAWTAETLDEDLNEAARDYVNHPRGVSFRRDGRLEVSSIYRWFREDFGGTENGVIAHLLQFADDDLAERINARPDIAGHEYDWSLNDIAS